MNLRRLLERLGSSPENQIRYRSLCAKPIFFHHWCSNPTKLKPEFLFFNLKIKVFESIISRIKWISRLKRTKNSKILLSTIQVQPNVSENILPSSQHQEKSFILAVDEDEAAVLPISTDFFLCVYAIFLSPLLCVFYVLASWDSSCCCWRWICGRTGFLAAHKKCRISLVWRTINDGILSARWEPLKVGPSWKSSSHFAERSRAFLCVPRVN